MSAITKESTIVYLTCSGCGKITFASAVASVDGEVAEGLAEELKRGSRLNTTQDAQFVRENFGCNCHKEKGPAMSEGKKPWEQCACSVRNDHGWYFVQHCAFHQSAPDLLEALKEVVAISDRKHDAWDKAKSIIAKAEGGQS